MTSVVLSVKRNGFMERADAGVFDLGGEGVGLCADPPRVREPSDFPDRAELARAADELELLALELDREEEEWRAGEERRRRRERHRAQRGACRELLEKTLQVRFLRSLRNGGWQRLGATLGALDALIPDETARLWFALAAGRGAGARAGEAQEGRECLRRKVLSRLRRRGLVEVRTSEESRPVGRSPEGPSSLLLSSLILHPSSFPEVRCTPRPPQGFALDEEFEHFLPRPADEVFGLEQTLLAQGSRNALVVWRQENVLAGDYDQFRFLALIGGEYDVEYRDFEDRQEVRDWLWQRRRGGRRCSRLVTRYFVGRRYNAMKERHGLSPTGTTAERALLQRTVDLLSREYGLAPALVERCAEFAAALDRGAEACGDDLRVRMLFGPQGLNGETYASKDEGTTDDTDDTDEEGLGVRTGQSEEALSVRSV